MSMASFQRRLDVVPTSTTLNRYRSILTWYFWLGWGALVIHKSSSTCRGMLCNCAGIVESGEVSRRHFHVNSNRTTEIDRVERKQRIASLDSSQAVRSLLLVKATVAESDSSSDLRAWRYYCDSSILLLPALMLSLQHRASYNLMWQRNLYFYIKKLRKASSIDKSLYQWTGSVSLVFVVCRESILCHAIAVIESCTSFCIIDIATQIREK